jgi:molybdate transport system substrate-binding protein
MSRSIFNSNIARGAGYTKTWRLLWSSAAAIGALAATPAGAATCDPASGSYDATIAVASNFFEPAKDLRADFTASGQPGFGKVIRICHGSTGSLNTEIRSGNANGYSLFLAANMATPIGLEGSGFEQSGATTELYAKGIPVLFAKQTTVSDVSTLVPSKSGVAATINYNNLTSNPLDTTNAATVAVADPTPAPYGNAAFQIMSSTPAGMNLFAYSTPGSEPNPLPAYLSSKYANIDLTFASVTGGTNKSGFVSKAQICSGVAPIKSGTPDYVYVEFTGSNYVLLQGGIRIDSGVPAQDTIGTDLLDFMLNNVSGTYWPNFLTNHCYGQI